MTMSRKSFPLLFACALLGLAGTVWAATANRIETAPQKAGASVTVPMVSIAHDGFLVIHDSDAKGNIIAPQSIGHVMIKAGTHKNVTVKLDHPVKAGKKLFAMLHKDTGKKGVYRFAASGGKADTPVVEDGKPVIVPFEVK